MGESMSKSHTHCTVCCTQPSDGSNSPLMKGCIKITIIRRSHHNGSSSSAHDRRKRAKSYEDVFKRESDFFRRTIRQPCELGSKLLTKNCLSFDDLTKIESEDVMGEQAQILIEVVTRKDCFVELYEILLEDESPLVDYLEIKRNSTEYVSDGDFVKKLGMRAFLTETDRKVLKKYYRYITRNTTNPDDIFTHLFQDGVIDEVTLEKLQNMHGETSKMEYFVQSNMSRWTYAELKNFCDILMDENSHVAKVLWPIVFTVDPNLRRSLSKDDCLSDTATDLSVDPKCENLALKVYKDNKTHRQTSIVLGNHGDVTSVVAGSIKITIVVQTMDSLNKLLRDINSGCMQHRFKGWVMSNKTRFHGGCVVMAEASRSDCLKAREVLEEHDRKLRQQGVLDTPIQFGFCKERGEWFWSHDGVAWCHVTRVRVPIGAHEGKVPRDEDIEVIQMLAKQHIPITRPVTPCPVCTLGKLSINNANIYDPLRCHESLHRGVPITVTFKIYKQSTTKEPPKQDSRKVPPDLIPHMDQRTHVEDSVDSRRADPRFETEDVVYSNNWVGALPLAKETAV